MAGLGRLSRALYSGGERRGTMLPQTLAELQFKTSTLSDKNPIYIICNQTVADYRMFIQHKASFNYKFFITLFRRLLLILFFSDTLFSNSNI